MWDIEGASRPPLLIALKQTQKKIRLLQTQKEANARRLNRIYLSLIGKIVLERQSSVLLAKLC